MQSYTKLKGTGDDLALALASDAQLFRLEATVRWLASCEARISRGDRLAIPSVGGLEDLTSGDVKIAGTNLSSVGRDGRALQRRTAIGYVFQELNLLNALTATENVALPLELAGAPRRSATSEASAALAAVDLGDKADRFPDDLSGGERQRVAIARALVGKNRLRLADEDSVRPPPSSRSRRPPRPALRRAPLPGSSGSPGPFLVVDYGKLPPFTFGEGLGMI